jgi:hypothetical protein
VIKNELYLLSWIDPKTMKFYLKETKARERIT